MSSVYTSSYVEPPASYTIPSDGDPKTAASVNVALQALADSVHFLKEGGVHSGAQSYLRVLAPFQHSGTSAINTNGALVQNSTGGTAYYPFEIPEGQSLTFVRVRVDPAGGHTVFGNINKPTFAVLEHNTATDITTIVGGAETVDPSGSIGAYEPSHNIDKTGFSHVCNHSVKRYCVRVTLESGTDFQAGLVIHSVTIGFTVVSQDFGGT